ncbi:alpha/beta hydrolase, partial [Colletotrichum chrysophilum]
MKVNALLSAAALAGSVSGLALRQTTPI